jgi:hypothetical protein
VSGDEALGDNFGKVELQPNLRRQGRGDVCDSLNNLDVSVSHRHSGPKCSYNNDSPNNPTLCVPDSDGDE